MDHIDEIDYGDDAGTTDIWGNPCMSDKELFGLLAKALARKAPKRLLLTKSIVATKRKPIAPKKPVLVRTGPSDRELSIMLGDACARGWVSGTAALEAQRLVEHGKPMPKAVRDILLARGR